MDLLLILTYTALCVAVFKVFKIPLNKWTVPTAVLGGVVIVGALLLTMNFNHFYSESVRQYFVTTPRWFRQNSLLRLTPGSEAEVTLDGVPSVIFKGKAKTVLAVIGEGQLKPGADFLRFDQERNPGRVPVAIEITDPALEEYRLPLGVFGQGAIYSEHFHHIGVMRRVLLRMAAWMNYVFPLH